MNAEPYSPRPKNRCSGTTRPDGSYKALRTGEVLGANLTRQNKSTASAALQGDKALHSVASRLKQYVPKADPSLTEWHAYDIPP